MKQLLIFFICLFGLSAYGQESDTTGSDDVQRFAVVERIPVALGCYALRDSTNEALKACFQSYILRHISQHFQFPKSAGKEKVYAKIYVHFIIEKSGEVSEVEVVRGAADAYKDEKKAKRQAAKELDEEAKRVVEALHFIEPAVQRGKPVRMSFTLPINAVQQ